MLPPHIQHEHGKHAAKHAARAYGWYVTQQYQAPPQVLNLGPQVRVWGVFVVCLQPPHAVGEAQKAVGISQQQER
jgi:hypothetical protein